VRRSYPQIYESPDKLLLDLNKIKVTKGDFLRAMRSITPSSHRSSTTHAYALSPIMRPLLDQHLQALLHLTKKNLGAYIYEDKKELDDDDWAIDDDPDMELVIASSSSSAADSNSISVDTSSKGKEKEGDEEDITSDSSRTSKSMEDIIAKYQSLYLPHPVHRPRLLVHGDSELGQAEVAAALLHSLEQYPVFSLDLASLCADTVAKVTQQFNRIGLLTFSLSFNKSLEEACVHIFTEARRKVPSIVYVPHMDAWWGMAPPSLQLTFLTVMNDIPPSLPLLILGTSDKPKQQLPGEISSLFASSHQMIVPNEVKT